MQGLAGRSDLPHQDRRRLQVSIGVGDVGVAEVGAEGNDMAANDIAIVAALLQGAYGKGVSLIPTSELTA